MPDSQMKSVDEVAAKDVRSNASHGESGLNGSASAERPKTQRLQNQTNDFDPSWAQRDRRAQLWSQADCLMRLKWLL